MLSMTFRQSPPRRLSGNRGSPRHLTAPTVVLAAVSPRIEMVLVPNAPKPLGNYSHAVRYGTLIVVSGIAARDPLTDKVPGLKLGPDGQRLSYDIRLETRSTLENIRTILEGVESSLENILEVNTYLTDMGDFQAYNEVYAEFFKMHHPARTTIGVSALPGAISIEMKVLAVTK